MGKQEELEEFACLVSFPLSLTQTNITHLHACMYGESRLIQIIFIALPSISCFKDFFCPLPNVSWAVLVRASSCSLPSFPPFTLFTFMHNAHHWMDNATLDTPDANTDFFFVKYKSFSWHFTCVFYCSAILLVFKLLTMLYHYMIWEYLADVSNKRISSFLSFFRDIIQSIEMSWWRVLNIRL